MKILYCTTAENTDDLKEQPTTYRSSKIKTLHIRNSPHYIEDFQTVRNMEYLRLSSMPKLAKLWNDMMSKRTFSYNFEHLNSKCLYDEYVEYNKEVSELIRSQGGPGDLVIVNDPSLYLLPSMIEHKVAIRNILFDESFIERVPFFKPILWSLFKADKFFADRESLRAFNNYVDCEASTWDADRGGCWYMKIPVNKERVKAVVQACHAHLTGENMMPGEGSDELKRKVSNFLSSLPAVPASRTILTNVPLLHLESFIKHSTSDEHQRIVIKYLRDSVEVDTEQERMIQYLGKTYESTIEVVDTYDFDMIVLEMLHCDVFVGGKYFELAKMLRKPLVCDQYDPVALRDKIEACIGRIESKKHVHGEDEYLKDFMEINGFKVEPQKADSCDGLVDSMVVDYITKRKESVKDAMPLLTISGSRKSTKGKTKKCGCELYEKIEKGRNLIFKRVKGDECKKCDGKNCDTKKMREVVAGDGKEEELVRCSNERNCYCNNGKSYDDGKGSVCDCKAGMPPKKKPLLSGRDLTKRKVPKADFEKIKEGWDKSKKVVLLDYDGTLTDLTVDPGDAVPSKELIDLLLKLGNAGRCAICTGRSCSDIDKWFPPEIEVFAEHGALHRSNGKWEKCSPVPRLDECREVMKFYAEKTPGTFIENKETGSTFHFAGAPGFNSSHLFSLLRKIVGDSVCSGKGVMEIRSASKDVVSQSLEPDICIGDDMSDEDMFAFCKGTAIRVGDAETTANCHVMDIHEVLKLLNYLAE